MTTEAVAASPSASTTLRPGKVITSFGYRDDSIWDIAVMPDGRIVVAGESHTGFFGEFAVARYNANGTPDTTFSVDGVVTTLLGPESSYGRSVDLLPDGRILVTGSEFRHTSDTFGGRHSLAMARYLTDGSLDTTFSSDGKVLLDASSDVFATGAAIQPDGTIIVIGGNHAAKHDVLVTKFKADGTPDASFATTGQRIIDIGPDSIGARILLQANGKIIVIGEAVQTGVTTSFVLARLNSDGMLDASFSSDGLAAVVFGDAKTSSSSSCGALQADGKILVAGTAQNAAGGDDFALARLNTDGTLDTTFAGDGRLTTDFASGKDGATCIAVQPDGKILVGGYATSAGSRDFALARYNSDGTPDLGFSGDGKMTIDFDGTSDTARALSVLPDGKIVIAGHAYRAGTTMQSDFALARVNADGSLDLSFGAGAPANTAPLITSFNGQSSARIDRDENVAAVTTVSARDLDGDPLRFSITGGADKADFQIDAVTGALSYVQAPDFESPTDANKDNVYEVIVSVDDGRGGADSQTLTVAVANLADAVRGGPGNDNLVGSAAPETIEGFGGRDRLTGRGGNDVLIGGSGIDTAVYSLTRSQYRVAEYGTGVAALGGFDGTDTLKEIERLAFADMALAFDLDGHAGTVARYLGAVFGKAAVADKAYVGIGLKLLDDGSTGEQLMQRALEAKLGTAFSHTAEVDLLYRNLLDRAPDAGELAYWTGELARGEISAVSLAQMAAQLEMNATNIGLAGLAESGLPYQAS